VIWKGTFSRLKVRPQEGLEMVATGRITTFPGKSAYQIVVESVEPAGIGALMALLEERRRKLAAEGLFEAERKRRLPYLPRVIGVVTSPTGAVIRDILHRLQDRFPRHVLVWPVRVQGETCGDEVAAAIRGFNALTPGGRIPRPDVIIVARGGGSVEDLWGFNDEAVVRAAAESALPLVSAVGHETDWTLIDHVADMRAPTPTGAAEMVVPVRAELVATVHDLDRRQGEAARRLVERRRADLRSAARALPDPDALFQVKRQRLDLATARLLPALARATRSAESRLAQLAAALARQSPGARLAASRARLVAIDHRPREAVERFVGTRRKQVADLGERLSASRDALARGERARITQRRELARRAGERLGPAFGGFVARERAVFDTQAKLFGSLNYRAVLERGYALVRDEAGAPVRSSLAAGAAGLLNLEFADGSVRALPAEGAPRPVVEAPPRPPRRKAAAAAPQASLFDL
jgi:exodeoxyribonuclease VII large subunit